MASIPTPTPTQTGSPTRRSFLSGRFPNHLTTVQPDGSNLCSDFLPLAVDIISEKLATAGCKIYIEI